MKPVRPPRIALVAGEDSGDVLGADLIAGLRRLQPACDIHAVAGPKMRAQGVGLIHPAEDFAVMGFGEVIRHLPRLLALKRKILRRLLELQPDVVVGIDAPDLNLPIERQIKKQGLKVIHYVSPSVWAWRAGRAKKMAAVTDAVLTLFPFEPSWYTRHGGRACFVGHPLARSLPLAVDKAGEKQRLGLAADTSLVALLPGSRWHEIRSLSHDFLQAARIMQKRMPTIRFVTASPGADKVQWLLHAASQAGVQLETAPTASQALLAADAALLASGTVALEAMLCKTPMVVAYRVSSLTYGIVKGFHLLKQPWYSLPNVLEGDFLVPEIMQHAITPASLSEAVLAQLDPARRERLCNRFTHHHRRLLPPQTDAAAQAVLQVATC